MKQSTVCIICTALTPLPLLLFSHSAPFFFPLFGHVSVFRLPQSPSQGVYPRGWKARSDFSAFHFPFNGPGGRRMPALTCLDPSDLHPSRQHELIPPEVRKILPSLLLPARLYAESLLNRNILEISEH